MLCSTGPYAYPSALADHSEHYAVEALFDAWARGNPPRVYRPRISQILDAPRPGELTLRDAVIVMPRYSVRSDILLAGEPMGWLCTASFGQIILAITRSGRHCYWAHERPGGDRVHASTVPPYGGDFTNLRFLRVLAAMVFEGDLGLTVH